MLSIARYAAAFVAFLFLTLGPLRAEDITLLSREGNIVISGRLQGYDGDFYRLITQYGPLTVDGQGVICEGPACPDMTAPRALIRFVGAPEAGSAVLPGLLRAFAQSRGLVFAETTPLHSDRPRADQLAKSSTIWAGQILDPESHQLLADLSFTPMGPADAAKAQSEGAADIEVSFRNNFALGSMRAVAQDALVAIMAPANPTPKVASPDLAAALSGQITNWQKLGGPDMPLILHGLEEDSDLAQALSQRLGRPIAASIRHKDQASLAEAVARDPWALAITGASGVGPAKRITLTDSCGFPMLAQPIAVKAGDYPLALPLFFVTPPRRLPLLAREFLDFLALPEAESAISAAGFIDRSVARSPMTDDGLRLLKAIQGAGEDVSLSDLKRLADVMDGADRLSLTFRFEEGTSILDPQSAENLTHLAQLIGAEHFPAEALILAGFSDGKGDAKANEALSLERADRVVSDLRAIAPDLNARLLPRTEGFGEALPMACDETMIGRHLNRRVELWVVPDFKPAPL